MIHTRYDALRRATKKTVDPINWNDGTGSVVLNAAGLDDPWSYQYDVFGNLSRATDPLSHYTTYDYDALDRLTRTTLHNGADTALEYDNLGNLKKVTDPADNVTNYTSDYLHRRRSEQTSFGTESYLYDLAGNLIWKMDRLDQITRYDFDKLGRVVQERWKNTAGTTIRKGIKGTGAYIEKNGVFRSCCSPASNRKRRAEGWCSTFLTAVSAAAGAYGSTGWTGQTAEQLGLKSTLQRRGRPQKEPV